jgi:hypothetical protein
MRRGRVERFPNWFWLSCRDRKRFACGGSREREWTREEQFRNGSNQSQQHEAGVELSEVHHDGQQALHNPQNRHGHKCSHGLALAESRKRSSSKFSHRGTAQLCESHWLVLGLQISHVSNDKRKLQVISLLKNVSLIQ